MRAHLRNRARARSLTTVAPTPTSNDYSPDLARYAASILYESPIRSKSGHQIYILNAAALPDVNEVEYDALLPYVLSRLPGEDELVSGTEYEVILFAGSGGESSTATKKSRPGWGWLIQAYHVLSRAMRKRIQKLYIVHERTWVRLIAEMFSTVVSPKFRRKIVHASSLSQLASSITIEDLLIPPSAYLQDRTITPSITVPDNHGTRAFAAPQPFPVDYSGTRRLPRVLRETTSFVLTDGLIQTEGIFRISASAKLREIVREAYDRGQKFIIWKDRDIFLPLPNYLHAINSTEIVQEMDQSEVYGVHLAAGLIKLWYTELDQPLVPQTAYREIVLRFGEESEISPDQLVDLIAPFSEWSPLPSISREILTRHLLPLLSEVSGYEESNKMNAENLIVCFAPTLVRGPDQMEDIKISAILRKIFSAAVIHWPQLRDVLGVDPKTFKEDLKAPEKIEDYEDPVNQPKSSNSTPSSPSDVYAQRSGIILKDNDGYQSDSSASGSEPQSARSMAPPPLPPRTLPGKLSINTHNTQPPSLPPRSVPSSSSAHSDRPPLPPRNISNENMPRPGSSGGSPFRRKPTPTSADAPPRYSTIMANDMSESPSAYTGPADGFGPPRRGDWSLHESDLESPAVPIAPPPSAITPIPAAITTPSPAPITNMVKRKPVASVETPKTEG